MGVKLHVDGGSVISAGSGLLLLLHMLYMPLLPRPLIVGADTLNTGSMPCTQCSTLLVCMLLLLLLQMSCKVRAYKW
jgi:hypothetical protein